MKPHYRSAALTLGLLALGSTAAAQSRFFWSQIKDGGLGLDDAAHDVAIGAGGQVFVAAFQRNATNIDALFLAYDAYGHALWERTIDLGGEEYALQLELDPASGDVLAVGTATPTPSAPHWVLWRLAAATGAVVWQTDYPGPQLLGGTPRDMLLDSSGGLVVSGSSGVGAGQIACVARFDSAGVLSWERPLPLAGGQFGTGWDLAASPSGDLLVKTSASLGTTQWTIHRLTSSGAISWSLPIGATENGAGGPLFDPSSNVLYSINAPAVGGHVIEKRDPAGNPLWSVDVATLFGANASCYGLAVDASGDVLALNVGGELVRLDPNGNLIWMRSVPAASWFDVAGSYPSGILLGSGGEIFVRYRSRTLLGEDYDSIASWDGAGNFRWSQSVRGLEPNAEVQTYGMELAPQGSVVIGGRTGPVGGTLDVFVAAVHESSQLGCFGDGSSGPCPCGNNVAAGLVSGCRATAPGVGVRLDDQGISSLGSDSVRFYAVNLPPSGVAVLLQGNPGVALPFQAGLSCMAGPLRRIYSASFNNSLALDLGPAGAARVHARSAALGDPIQ